MKFKSIIKSNHALKKNGYKILRKLHKLEKKKNLDYIYSATCKEGYFFILACKNLIKLITNQYNGIICSSNLEKFSQQSDLFLKHLENAARNRKRINKHLLSSYLKTFTIFFNIIIENKTEFRIRKELLEEWNQKCIMAYISAWGQK